MAKVPVHNGSLGGEEYVSGLEGLHQAFSVALGKPVYAPLDISTSGLRVLDSGCNSGKWLLDLAGACSPATHENVGTDLWTEVFPGDLPSNFHFYGQDICKPWPESWQGTFDLVHQRTVLVNARKMPLQDVLSPMARLLKPGGWIQLMEGDFADVEENGPAMREFLDLGKWFFEEAGPGSDMGPRLKSELSNIGLQNVESTTVMVGIGAVLNDKGQSAGIIAGSIEGLCAAIPGSLINLRDMDHPFSLEKLNSLEERLRKELAEVGGHIRYRVAWGMK